MLVSPLHGTDYGCSPWVKSVDSLLSWLLNVTLQICTDFLQQWRADSLSYSQLFLHRKPIFLQQICVTTAKMLLWTTFTAWNTKMDVTSDSMGTQGKLPYRGTDFWNQYSATLMWHKPVKFRKIPDLMSTHIIWKQTDICILNIGRHFLSSIYIHYYRVPRFQVA
jgi:hypothetical protein